MSAITPPVLRILWRDPAELSPSVLAVKVHSETKLQALTAAVAAFGLDQPLVLDAAGRIIKGTARRDVALRLKLRQVPVLLREDLTPEACRAAALADNRCGEGHWQPEALAAELKALKNADPSGDLLRSTGFTVAEIQGLLQQAPPPARARQAVLPEFSDQGRWVQRCCPHCGGALVH